MKKFILFVSAILIVQFLSAQGPTDIQGIHNSVDLLKQGWDSGSGATFAQPFADTHDFVVWNGYYFKENSQQQNARSHDWLFKQVYPNTQLHYVVDKIKMIRPDIALVHVLGAVEAKGMPKPEHPRVLISMVMEKTNENWKILSFHNLDLEAFENEEVKKNAPVPTEVMYASWYTTK